MSLITFTQSVILWDGVRWSEHNVPTPSLQADRVRQVAKVSRIIRSDHAATAGVPVPFASASITFLVVRQAGNQACQ